MLQLLYLQLLDVNGCNPRGLYVNVFVHIYLPIGPIQVELPFTVTIRNRVSRGRMHVDLLMQLAMNKSILHIKLRDGPSANRSNSNKSMDSGPMGNKSKGL